MRKALLFTLTLTLIFAFAFRSAAADEEETEAVTKQADTVAAAKEEPTVNMSAPKLMVTSYSLENDCIVPGEKSAITVTLKNTNAAKSIRNLKLTLSDETGEIIPENMGTAFVGYIGAGEEYVWETSLSAVNTAAEGRHRLTLSAEYEDTYYSSFSASDNIYVDVKQPVSLDFDGVVLPVKIIQDDTATMTINVMNTGKSVLGNVKIESDVKNLKSGGSVFVGEIPAGESKTANVNFLAPSDFSGKASGKITISYEDVYGEKYTLEQNVSTLIEEKTAIADIEETDEPKYPFWWVFMLGGLAAGGIIGAAVPIAIYSSRQRKADEERL